VCVQHVLSHLLLTAAVTSDFTLALCASSLTVADVEMNELMFISYYV